jgi:REP element-mobilizing transposase RayT
LRKGEKDWGYIIYAYVIMPDHVHLMIKPLKGNRLAKIMNQIKGVSSRKINALLKQSGNLWQKGFHDFTIYEEKKFKEKFNYIHYNPVKWKLAEFAEDYPFSSAKYYKNMCNAVYYE